MIKILELLNKLYKKDKVTNDIVEALVNKLSKVESGINDLYKQIFLDSADWYVSVKEEEMGISKRIDSLQARRDYVKTRLLGTGTATKEMIEGVANSIDGVKCEIQFSDMCITVIFLKAESNKYLSVVKRAVENIIPYHLGLKIEYERVNWGEIKKVNWGDLKKFTWGAVSESVADTILKGLDDSFD